MITYYTRVRVSDITDSLIMIIGISKMGTWSYAADQRTTVFNIGLGEGYLFETTGIHCECANQNQLHKSYL